MTRVINQYGPPPLPRQTRRGIWSDRTTGISADDSQVQIGTRFSIMYNYDGFFIAMTMRLLLHYYWHCPTIYLPVVAMERNAGTPTSATIL